MASEIFVIFVSGNGLLPDGIKLYYENQCWLIINENVWHSSDGNFTDNAQGAYPWYEFGNCESYITATSPQHWGRATHICIGKLTIIGSDNGLSPGRRQAIIWTIAGILLIGPLGTNFSEMSIEIHTFSFKKINLKMSFGKWWSFCLGLNVLKFPLQLLVLRCWHPAPISQTNHEIIIKIL